MSLRQALKRQQEMLNDLNYPRNLDYYMSLPGRPSSDGYGEGIHLCNKAVVLLLLRDERWRQLAEKAANWFTADYHPDTMTALRRWSLLSWACRSYWLIERPMDNLIPPLRQAHEDSYSEGDAAFISEQGLLFMGLGLANYAQVALIRAEVSEGASERNLVTANVICQAGLRLLAGDRSNMAFIKKSLWKRCRQELNRGNFAGSVPWAIPYRLLFEPHRTAATTLQLIARGSHWYIR